MPSIPPVLAVAGSAVCDGRCAPSSGHCTAAPSALSLAFAFSLACASFRLEWRASPRAGAGKSVGGGRASDARAAEEQWNPVEPKAVGSPQLLSLVHSPAPRPLVQKRVDQVGALPNSSAPVVSAGTIEAASGVSFCQSLSVPVEGACAPSDAGTVALVPLGANRVSQRSAYLRALLLALRSVVGAARERSTSRALGRPRTRQVHRLQRPRYRWFGRPQGVQPPCQVVLPPPAAHQ
jgi:hypothetical protein